MDRFFYEEPIPEKTIKFLQISSDKLTQTIAHEIAHAFQTAKNVNEDKIIPDGQGGTKFSELFSDCFESGKGRRNEDHDLVEPENPKLVKEHKQFEIEIEQMMKKDPLFQNFITWWEANS